MRFPEDHLLKNSLDAPPILPNIEDELKNLIECPENLPIHQIDNVQLYWPRKCNLIQLLNCDLAPISTTIKFKRDPINGIIGDVHEINLPSVGKTSKNSMSMDRAPGPPCEGVKGNTSNYLFWPGGFDEPEKNECNLMIDIDFNKNLKTCVKGQFKGIEFQSDNKTPKTSQSVEEDTESNTQIELESSNINLMNVIDEESSYLYVPSMTRANNSEVQNDTKTHIDLPPIDENITKLSATHKIPVLKISEATCSQAEWAEQLNVQIPITDFDKKVPDPALTFPYKLDNFQKQAIIKLEENCNVFVAAHTSAGKTTVAEYAIALSQKHMTRTIYTSPIKALSNQKFREFKEKFESVGLITGDIQINAMASCLIMTTEILQSMLYGASEVIRDLEYVIFDEVHYINNEDRGHVWEEIVILLPQTVTIVMLSATVPNPLQFANWVGKIKQRKMFVISTVKRPVPLQHFLYTGTDMQTKDEAHLLVDTDGHFNDEGTRKWIEEKAKIAKGKEKKSGQLFNYKIDKQRKYYQKQFKQSRGYNSEQSIAQTWAPLLEYLTQNDKLPVVVFSFSRNRCNLTAKSMKRRLINDQQKQEVLEFFKIAIKRLKDTDATLPQVKMIRKLLTVGIGIHHSGILPILKEIVEMLFQKGLVKMLFATETFAMGVNMPARTVVFDSVRKFDGNAFRMLHPTEYIQMAGRAGRRGHDSIGTVMIYCKNDIPKLQDLGKMICGEPQSLQSRFKVTYSMVLHLRRLSETISVKDMMRRSFGEAGTQHNQKQCMFEYEQVEKELANINKLITKDEDLFEFYDIMEEYLNLYKKITMIEMMTKNVRKLIKEERVLLVWHKHHVNKLGIILSVEDNKLKVFVLKNAHESVNEEKPEIWYKMMALNDNKLFVPTGQITYEIITIKLHDILEITNNVIKCDIRGILSNWDNRQLYKARNAAPNQACFKAIDQLMNLTMEANNNISLIAPAVKIKMDLNLSPLYARENELHKQIMNRPVKDIGQFVKEFEPIFKIKELLNKKEALRQKLNGETMEHYTEYKCRIEILKSLSYIDQDERVTLKGRVALEMGTHELLLTELVLKNILTNWDPAEIAAMLSALVFQKRKIQRDEKEKEITHPRLHELEKIVQNEFDLLVQKEIEMDVPQLAPISFELIYVVYKWAKQESFASIMHHTDIQEGIIVRCIQQLNETLRDVRNAAIIIGNPILKTKMEQASTAIKRDIVFAASLYTQD